MPVIIFSFLVFLLSAGEVNASTVTINPGQSLSNAVSLASDGDTILVNSGQYSTGNINVRKNNLVIEAQGQVTLIGGFEVYGNGNTIRGFALTDRNSKTAIRTYGNNNLIEGNEIYDTKEDAMWLWGQGNIIRGNYMHDIYDDRDWPSYDEHVDCFMTWAWSPTTGVTKSEDTVIENNICILDRPHGSNQFFILTHRASDGPTTIKNFTFRNNVFISKDPGYVPLAFFGDSTVTGFKIYNNTFYNTTGQGEDAVWLENMPSVHIANNAIIGYGSVSRNLNSTLVSEANRIGPTNLGSYSSFAVTRVSKRAFSISGFSPQAGSNLVDQGINLSGLGVTSDFSGTPRPQGVGFDIGAFEKSQQMSVTSTPTLTPTPTPRPTSTPTPTPGYCPSDIDRNYVVGGSDVQRILTKMATTCSGCAEDINGDGNINTIDYLQVQKSWGNCSD